jgi:hypothetical protein
VDKTSAVKPSARPVPRPRRPNSIEVPVRLETVGQSFCRL